MFRDVNRWPQVSDRERALESDPRRPRTAGEITALVFIVFGAVSLVLAGLFEVMLMMGGGDSYPTPPS